MCLCVKLCLNTKIYLRKKVLHGPVFVFVFELWIMKNAVEDRNI